LLSPMKPFSYFLIILLFGLLSAFSSTAVFSQCASGNETTFNYSGTIETYTVPSGVTQLHITVRGAEGGNSISSNVAPGLGAEVEGDFNVSPGMQLKILVGENPSLTTGGGNGGGGGSFVTMMDNTPLIIAGGGGGSAVTTDSPNKHGQAGTTGGTGAASGSTGGTAGNGGNNDGTSSFISGSGGGLLTDGADGWASNTGGDAFLNGGAGATSNGAARGGFGGGGSGSAFVVGGGGGGYSGGGGGGNSSAGVGGGGASFNADMSGIASSGVWSGHGQIVICEGTSPIVPTLSQWGLIVFILLLVITGTIGMRYYRKRHLFIN
jgi:hypothetical protein